MNNINYVVLFFKSPLKITDWNVRTEIGFRFAQTHIVSRVTNPESTAREGVYRVTLPKRAFISNFTM